MTDVDCPHCHVPLFTLTSMEGKTVRTEQIPEMQDDGQGYFMVCPRPNCQKRINFETVQDGFQISPNQGA
jgi:hypothetical protein